LFLKINSPPNSPPVKEKPGRVGEIGRHKNEINTKMKKVRYNIFFYNLI